MDDLLKFAACTMVGLPIQVQTKSGLVYQGVLNAINVADDFGVSLCHACVKPTSNAKAPFADPPTVLKPSDDIEVIVIQGKDIAQIFAVGANLDARGLAAETPAGSGSGAHLDAFTDVGISKNRGGGERELERFAFNDDEDADLGGLEDDDDDTSGYSFKQMADAYQAQTGETLSYNETDYSTVVDTSGPDFERRRRAAEKLAKDIDRGKKNQHTATRHAPADDEESLHSAVVRNPSATSNTTSTKPSGAGASRKATAERSDDNNWRRSPATAAAAVSKGSKAAGRETEELKKLIDFSNGFQISSGSSASSKRADVPKAEATQPKSKPQAKPKSSGAKSSGAKSTDSKPADSKPADSKPADSKPADPKPADSKPADSAAAEATPKEPAAETKKKMTLNVDADPFVPTNFVKPSPVMTNLPPQPVHQHMMPGHQHMYQYPQMPPMQPHQGFAPGPHNVMYQPQPPFMMPQYQHAMPGHMSYGNVPYSYHHHHHHPN
ncbi:uncharacterized protein MONBRDRAFT_28426 [Monosiga brevicollis MX1]|uniref:LsmAD domain-containing protein n=1 Tax=Monosiga brevicollis TaxID=81824 RepID=A9V850_MONBE|nr:uncharacterized protein MONBRDRAFT_28426 [Monosiga brevicollis MX1]EDQ86209.1 predicted protein [Monosiga brevicollis MX1]|eukprot:XP_001748879.1 hypothetical protein [Monosiga brevicollis MX1]